MREAIQAENSRADSRGSAAHASVDNFAAIRRRNQRVHRGTSEPPTVALLRHVLNPSVIVLTLMFCAFLFAQQLTPSYFALAALAFLIASQIVSEPVMDCSVRNGLTNLLQHRIFAEWLLVSAALLLMAFAFKVTETFSRRVILTWFAITPFAVVA
ncbi:MAG TPA: hypothetical protein VNR40_01445, partial [Steroidobacter sp.]|nr:hypothetical protein [Steroidobacter sp.]